MAIDRSTALQGMVPHTQNYKWTARIGFHEWLTKTSSDCWRDGLTINCTFSLVEGSSMDPSTRISLISITWNFSSTGNFGSRENFSSRGYWSSPLLASEDNHRQSHALTHMQKQTNTHFQGEKKHLKKIENGPWNWGIRMWDLSGVYGMHLGVNVV